MIRIMTDEKARLEMIDRTLERIGIANSKTKTIIPTCYLIKVGNRYYIAHFKELLALEQDTHCYDVDPSSQEFISEDDIARRDNIVSLMLDWGVIKLHGTVDASKLKTKPMNFKVLRAAELPDWTICHKYTINH